MVRGCWRPEVITCEQGLTRGKVAVSELGKLLISHHSRTVIRSLSVSPTSLGTNLGRCWASPPAPSCWRRWGLCPPASTCPGDGSRPPVSCLGSVSSSADIWIAQYWFSPRAFPLSPLSHLAVLEKNSRLTLQYSHSSSAAAVLTILLQLSLVEETKLLITSLRPDRSLEVRAELQHWLTSNSFTARNVFYKINEAGDI